MSDTIQDWQDDLDDMREDLAIKLEQVIKGVQND